MYNISIWLQDVQWGVSLLASMGTGGLVSNTLLVLMRKLQDSMHSDWAGLALGLLQYL
jgi:hypothetical protein